MSNLFTLKILSVILTLIIALAAGQPIYKTTSSKTPGQYLSLQAFACGIFLGLSLVHLLPDATHLMQNFHIVYPLASLIMAATFILLLLAEHVGSNLAGKHLDNFTILLSVFILSMHSLFAGSILGLSNQLNTVILLLIAIVAHKWAASFAMAVKLKFSPLTKNAQLICFIVFALMTPFGIVFGTHMQHIMQSSLMPAVFTAIGAGTFLFIGTLHGPIKSLVSKCKHENCCNLQQFTWMMVGFGIMAVVAIWS